MSVVNKCCGLDLRNTRLWRSIGFSIGCIAFTGCGWLAYEVSFPPDNLDTYKLVKFTNLIFHTLFITHRNAKDYIVKCLCGINLMASISWLFGISSKKLRLTKVALNWFACILIFFACYLITGIFNWISTKSEQSTDAVELIFDILLHILAIVLGLGFYITAAICNISLKECLNEERLTRKWPAVCQTFSAKNGYDSDI
ncbi:uncharacterized protein LOC116349014 [Contarinia nasturtii]|uniref:uncharacterized protein LOC116349014 n=1 Tax=Contarinia nasturtii TaxID=265458 RepID=UPI0012D4A2F6|nr:uncharacterized protein LOC116349014 [Contarinia nasturtii]